MARLRLYYPVRPYLINQNFGANQPCVKDFGLPTQEVLDSHADGTCPVGSDKLYAHFGMAGHNGMDLHAGEQPIYAACAGSVVEKQTYAARGLGLGIMTDEPVFLDSFGTHFAKLRYWHLKTFNVEVGDKVKEGDIIGVTDNTGFSSADHLHFELDPMDKDKGGHPVPAFPDRGTDVIAGSIDPAPFFTGLYADQVQPEVSRLTRILQLLTEVFNVDRLIAAYKR